MNASTLATEEETSSAYDDGMSARYLGRAFDSTHVKSSMRMPWEQGWREARFCDSTT